MTPEARLDRLERIAKLFVKAGLRYRYDLREIGDKLNIVVNAQIRNEEQSKQNEVRLTKLAERTDRQIRELNTEFDKRQALGDRKFAEFMKSEAESHADVDRKFSELAVFQKRTEESLAELIKIVRRGRNGEPASE